MASNLQFITLNRIVIQDCDVGKLSNVSATVRKKVICNKNDKR